MSNAEIYPEAAAAFVEEAKVKLPPTGRLAPIPLASLWSEAT